MIVTIRDRETLLSIDPNKAEQHLIKSGWVKVHLEPGRYSRWVKVCAQYSHPTEILLPMDKNLGDFAQRASEFLEVLQQEEKRSQIDILQDIKLEQRS